MLNALVTGGAGFIGSHLVDALLDADYAVTVVDNFDPFYSRAMKERNILSHRANCRWKLIEADITRPDALDALEQPIDVIVHLAAKAGVRPSVDDPLAYQAVNVTGTQNLLEFARRRGVDQFVFGSSSSVYGVNPRVPWSEDDHVLQPISPYASTKVSCELLGHVYSHLYGIRFVALRFFGVYGPRQRPDLAIHKFARLILEGKPVPIFGDGSTQRDYTYVGDIVTGIRAAMDYRGSQYEVINLGNDHMVSLVEVVTALEHVLDVKARVEKKPAHPADVPKTWANNDRARALLGYDPRTSFTDGVRAFVDWMNAVAVGV